MAMVKPDRRECRARSRSIRRAVQASGLTQEALAQKIGRSQSYVSKIVTGLVQPGIILSMLLARAVGQPVEVVFASYLTWELDAREGAREALDGDTMLSHYERHRPQGRRADYSQIVGAPVVGQ